MQIWAWQISSLVLKEMEALTLNRNVRLSEASIYLKIWMRMRKKKSNWFILILKMQGPHFSDLNLGIQFTIDGLQHTLQPITLKILTNLPLGSNRFNIIGTGTSQMNGVIPLRQRGYIYSLRQSTGESKTKIHAIKMSCHRYISFFTFIFWLVENNKLGSSQVQKANPNTWWRRWAHRDGCLSHV